MPSMFWSICSLLLVVLFALTVPGFAQEKDDDGKTIPPPPEPLREFRGVWIATVANIDWPSKPGLSEDEAKAEMITILDRVAELKLNAVVFQVRPAADAFYKSQTEPWSEWLTGKIGQAPATDWDPLAFTIDECRKRGLELHAWFNPYRAIHPSNKSKPPAGSLAADRPELVPEYGPYRWMDPGSPEVQRYSLGVIFDVVERYDIDGVHLDDYFYPYPRNDADGKPMPFPDDASYEAYQEQGGQLQRPDWRRENVNSFVRELYAGVKKRKPHVQVGISPFGIYRPGQPEFVKGLDQYDALYADPLLWFEQGWMDYLVPQLYWPIAKPDQSFTALLQWWNAHNRLDRHIWPGLATYRHFENPESYPEQEFVNQVKWSRLLTDHSDGHIHFSMKWLLSDAEKKPLAETLVKSVYAEDALPPATPWSAPDDVELPAPPVIRDVTIDGKRVVVVLEKASEDETSRPVVQVYRGEKWLTATGLRAQTEVSIDTGSDADVSKVVAYTVDRFGRAGEMAEWEPESETED